MGWTGFNIIINQFGPKKCNSTVFLEFVGQWQLHRVLSEKDKEHSYERTIFLTKTMVSP